jgi:3-phosphoshikimate 1-carboxyvinyltransferase
MLQYQPVSGMPTVHLPTSKSVSNRVVVLQYLANGNFSDLKNLSNAADTQLLLKALADFESGLTVLNIGHAGTAMRFLTALLALENYEGTLTGSDRMLDRPIGPLVSALQDLGFTVSCRDGNFPPVQFQKSTSAIGDTVHIDGHISSQFISALMMVGPLLPNGLTIHLNTPLTSIPYAQQTALLMEQFGASVKIEAHQITIPKGNYIPQKYNVEADWSAFGYIATCVLLTGKPCFIENLFPTQLQGDFKVLSVFEQLGLSVAFNLQGAEVSKKSDFNLPNTLVVNFSNIPDQAQTIMVLCAALRVHLLATGLHTLKIKETDRVTAVAQELAKFGITVSYQEEILPETLVEVSGQFVFNQEVISLKSYQDHRMVMAFAPLAVYGNLTFDVPHEVKKSFPAFWDELLKLGYCYI